MSIKKCRILILGLGHHPTAKIEPMQEIQARLGQKIRKLRREKGWSQEEFADKCGIGRAHMSLIERGQQNLTLATLHTICNVLGIAMATVLKGVA
jgi:DNA-binding XRE family transcriptional regulator